MTYYINILLLQLLGSNAEKGPAWYCEIFEKRAEFKIVSN